MTEPTKQEGEKKTLTLNKKPELKKSGDGGQVRQSFSHGRSKTVAVEVKKKRAPGSSEARHERVIRDTQNNKSSSGRLTDGEMESRMRAVQEALRAKAAEEERKKIEQEESERRKQQEEEERRRQEELAASQKKEEELKLC